MTAIDTSRTPEEPAASAAGGRSAKRPGLNTDTLALGGFFVAVFAFLAAIFAVGLAARAVGEAESAPAGSAASAAPTVQLMEFMIMPNPIQVPAGTTALTVENSGTIDHTLGIADGPTTETISAGESGTLDISSLAAGTYPVVCTVAGHKESGMTGTLTIA